MRSPLISEIQSIYTKLWSNQTLSSALGGGHQVRGGGVRSFWVLLQYDPFPNTCNHGDGTVMNVSFTQIEQLIPEFQPVNIGSSHKLGQFGNETLL